MDGFAGVMAAWGVVVGSVTRRTGEDGVSPSTELTPVMAKKDPERSVTFDSRVTQIKRKHHLLHDV